MRVDFDTSTSLVFQQTVFGAGTFDGTEIGRSTFASGIGNSQVVFKARKLGTDFDGYKFKMVDPGRDNPYEYVTWDPNDNRIQVVLRYAAGAVTSTAATVAAAVQSAGLIITASYGGNGTGLVVPAQNVLAGALDPQVLRNVQFKFSPATGVKGGRFSFDQAGNILIRQFEAKLGASVAWTLELINLDEGLMEVTGETVQLAGATAQTVMLTNINVVLSPLRALKFSAASTGVARVVAHKEPNFPLA